MKLRPKLPLDPATGNIAGCEIKCITGKPRVPRVIDRTLEHEFAQQIANALTSLEWESEYTFMPEPSAGDKAKGIKRRSWRFDFAWPIYKIAVEIEGGTWSGGRHTRGQGFEADAEKYNTAESMGWHVFRLTAAQVYDGRGVEWVMKLLAVKSELNSLKGNLMEAVETTLWRMRGGGYKRPITDKEGRKFVLGSAASEIEEAVALVPQLFGYLSVTL